VKLKFWEPRKATASAISCLVFPTCTPEIWADEVIVVGKSVPARSQPTISAEEPSAVKFPYDTSSQ
jgi:hypothetical protein